MDEHDTRRTLRLAAPNHERAPEESRPPRSTVRPAPPSAPPAESEQAPRRRFLTPLEELRARLAELLPSEIVDIDRTAQRILAARGEAADPDLVSLVVCTLERLWPTYRPPAVPGVPLPALRRELPDVPRALIDRALRAAVDRGLLRLLPVRLPAPFVEPSAGIMGARELLYYCAPVR